MSLKRLVEDLYPLSPLQEGMLFHTLAAPGTGVYCVHFGFDVHGGLDAEALRHAWQAVVDRHTVLRTFFAWENVEKPLQMVRRQLPAAIRTEDLRALDPPAQEARIAAYLRADRQRGFDLARPPLVRLALFRTGEDTHHLVWGHHHILMDGWSVPVLMQEVVRLYEARVRGRSVRLEEVRPFRDYIAWLQRQDLSRAEAFWRGTLRGFAASTQLVLPAGPADRDGHGEERASLPAAETARLEALARGHGLTMNTLVQGAWALLLARYSGEEDVVFATTVSGRPAELEGVEAMVGLFINTLPVRVQAGPAEPLLPWLRRLQERQAEMRDFEFTPLAQVQRWSELPAGAKIADTLVVFENYPVEEEGAEEPLLRVVPRDVVEQTSYGLSLAATPGAELSLLLAHSGAYDAGAAARMLEHLRTLLEGFVHAPGARLDELALLAAAEREQVLVAWSATTAESPRAGCVHELFTAQAALTPETAAVRWRGRQLSYAELDRRSSRLARHLRRRGVGPEVCVGVCLPRTPELLVALLGVLKAGGAYVPMDPQYPRERLGYMVEDAAIGLVLTESHLAGRLPESIPELLVLDAPEVREALAGEPGQAPGSGALPENLSHVIFTSGSTGRPKGVMVRHSSVTVFLHWLRGIVPDEERASLLFSTSVSFDVSVAEMWGALCWGGTLVLVENALDLASVADEGVRLATMVPAAAAELLRSGQIPDSVRAFNLAGEALPASLARELYGLGHVQAVRNLYGPTEDTTYSTYSLVEPGAERVVIGRPKAGSRAYVLDRHLQPVPVGVAGELYLGGAGLARGYVARPELTVERFLPDPHGEAGARMYRTGDRARWTASGELEYLGRADFQVKVRGFRIEPGEIEAALTRLPQVRECVVVVREDTPGQRRLVAYVVAEAGAQVSAPQLREELAGRLPEHMVPAAFVTLEALPLDPNGKVDRRALPKPEGGAGEGTEYEAPRTETEAVLAGLWAEVLGVERVGVHDDFFRLGGDSILAIRLIARARKATGVEIPLDRLLKRPTVGELAAAVSALRAEGGALRELEALVDELERMTEEEALAQLGGVARHVPLHEVARHRAVAPLLSGAAAPTRAEQGTVTGPVPLTPIQHRFLAQPRERPHHWNLPVLLEAPASLEPDLVERAAQALLAHHDALRLRFRRTETGWEQWCAAPDGRAVVERFDLGALSGGEQLRALEAGAERLQASLDLAAGPLFRIGTFHLGRDRPGRLLLVAHHLVVDGTSWQVVLEDLEAACAALAAGRTPAFPPKTTSWKAWAERLQGHALAGGFDGELAFWSDPARREIAPLPLDHPGEANPERAARTLALRLDAAATRALLSEVPAAYGTGVDEALLAALGRAFQRWTGAPTLLVDVEGHGREEILPGLDLSRTVGWFTTVHPVLLDLRAAGDAASALRAVHEQLRAVPGRGVGYGALRWLGGPAAREALSALPGAEVLFSYPGRADQALDSPSPFGAAAGSTGADRDPGSGRAHLLEVAVRILGGELEASWTYGSRLHDETTIRLVAEAFRGELRDLVEHCRTPAGPTVQSAAG